MDRMKSASQGSAEAAESWQFRRLPSGGRSRTADRFLALTGIDRAANPRRRARARLSCRRARAYRRRRVACWWHLRPMPDCAGRDRRARTALAGRAGSATMRNRCRRRAGRPGHRQHIGRTMPAFCRDCLTDVADDAPRVPRLRLAAPGAASPNSTSLPIAHVDCDAFYATIEKRDDPSLARRAGDHRRRPARRGRDRLLRRPHLRRAARRCRCSRRAGCVPTPRVVRPNMEKYVAVGREVRAHDAGADAAGRTAVDR